MVKFTGDLTVNVVELLNALFRLDHQHFVISRSLAAPIRTSRVDEAGFGVRVFFRLRITTIAPEVKSVELCEPTGSIHFVVESQ